MTAGTYHGLRTAGTYSFSQVVVAANFHLILLLLKPDGAHGMANKLCLRMYFEVSKLRKFEC